MANYKDFLAVVAQQEKAQYMRDRNTEPGTTDYNKERLMFNYGKKAAARQALLARAEAPLKAMETNLVNKLDATQAGKGAIPKDKSQSWFSDWANMLALTAVGVCLMIGLCTRLAALGAIGPADHVLLLHAAVARIAGESGDRGVTTTLSTRISSRPPLCW